MIYIYNVDLIVLNRLIIDNNTIVITADSIIVARIDTYALENIFRCIIRGWVWLTVY